MRKFARENGLSLFFFVLFVGTVLAESLAGVRAFNAEQIEHGSSAVSWLTYVTSPEFGGALMENWQSEFLQFSFFIAATICSCRRDRPSRRSSRTPGPTRKGSN